MRHVVTPRRQRVPRICAFCDHLRWRFEDGNGDRSPFCSIGLCLIDGMGSACGQWRCTRKRRESL